MAYRVRLIKKWVNTFGRSYPVGTVIQSDSQLANELIRLKYGVKYDGEYPPQKEKINLEQLNNN
jgi:hypothetical protein